MDLEFHYYATYLTATAASFAPADAFTIAYSSQYVDDNTFVFRIDQGKPSAYANYISQTVNITKPMGNLMRIYPLFHFVPGQPLDDACIRLDGCMHRLNTTPGSRNAHAMVDMALQSGSLHRLGVALHAFADTWAHQNFVGYFDAFNGLAGPLEQLSPNIGHADAGHLPDRPTAVWQDPRLLTGQIDNRQRFLAAAEAMLTKLATHVDPAMDQRELDRRVNALRLDLNQALGLRDDANKKSAERIRRYIELSEKPFFGGQEMPLYTPDLWLSQAIDEQVHGLKDRWMKQNLEFFGQEIPTLADTYAWRDPAAARTKDWFLFQEAVKAHQADAWAMLRQGSMMHLSLPRF